MDKAFCFSVYLVRHGIVKKKAGHLPAYDGVLCDEQVALTNLKTHLPDEAEWFVSPLKRAQQSFDILCPDGSKAIIDNRLEEQNFGRWHEQKIIDIWPEIDQHHQPHHPASFVNHLACPPDGTSFKDVFTASRTFLSDMIERRPTSPQIVVSHAGVTKALLGHMMGLNAAQSMMLCIDHGAVSRCDYIWKNDLPELVLPWQIHFVNRVY